MANRASSILLQVGTVVALGSAWLVARLLRSRSDHSGETSQYCISSKRYAVLSAVLLAADLYAIPAILRGKLAIDEEEFTTLAPETVPWIDRHALGYVGSRGEHYRRISDKVLQGLIALPLLLLLDSRIRKDWVSFATLYAWLHALTYTIYSFSPLGPAFVD